MDLSNTLSIKKYEKSRLFFFCGNYITLPLLPTLKYSHQFERNLSFRCILDIHLQFQTASNRQMKSVD